MGGQLDDLHFGLSEDMESLDVGGRHLGSQGIPTNMGFMKMMKRNTNLMNSRRQ